MPGAQHLQWMREKSSGGSTNLGRLDLLAFPPPIDWGSDLRAPFSSSFLFLPHSLPSSFLRLIDVKVDINNMQTPSREAVGLMLNNISAYFTSRCNPLCRYDALCLLCQNKTFAMQNVLSMKNTRELVMGKA